MVSRIVNKPSVKATLAIEIFYFAYFFRMIIGPSTTLGLIIYVIMTSVGLISLLYIIFIQREQIRLKIFAPLIALLFLGVISSLYTHNYRPEDFIIILQYFGVALILLNFKLNHKIVSISFMINVFYFIVNIILGRSPDDLFVGFSRNNIIVLMVLHSILFYISMYQNSIKLKYYPAIITVVLSFWAIGRSGIIVSFLLLLIITIYNQLKEKGRISNIIYITILILLTYSVVTTFFYDDLLKVALERTTRLGIGDNNREGIIEEYFYNVKNSLGSFFWGVPIYDNFIFSIYGFNLHNSYLRLHAYHGLFGVLILITLILKSVYKYIKKKEYLFLGLLLVLLVRMSTDIVAFHGPYDPLIYFFVLNSYFLKENKPILMKKGDS